MTMKLSQEQLLAILYELALILSQEQNGEALTQRFLQRLLYHTGFACGAYLHRVSDMGESVACRCEAAVGNAALVAQVGKTTHWPATLLCGDAAVLETGIEPWQWLSERWRYGFVLRLPCAEQGSFLLFSARTPQSTLPLTQVFTPVIRNFARTRETLLANEAFNALLAEEISERRRTEVLLREAKQMAEQADAAKAHFLASMTHEFRTPLHAVLGHAQLLELESLSVSGQEDLQAVLLAANHALEMVEQILDYSRLESGNISLSMSDVSLYDLLRQCVSILTLQAQAQQVSLAIEVQDNAIVFADAGRLRQVLLNLLSNAIKYNRVGGRVAVCVTSAHAGSMWRIEVSDTGAGMSQAQLAQLFIPFNRLGAEAGSVKGTGLGLVIAKRLIEAMAGHIGVHSTVGEGSRFWLELPAV